jgi:L-aminopeptidase/D-esterase-like protein
MIAFEFKAGSGTASRRIVEEERAYVVGAFVQANFGRRPNLIVRGHRLGHVLPVSPALPGVTKSHPGPRPPEKSSIIGVLATDAPLLPHQLARLARRMPLGVAGWPTIRPGTCSSPSRPPTAMPWPRATRGRAASSSCPTTA